jgi:cobalt ECF transporter T component CbiQ
MARQGFIELTLQSFAQAVSRALVSEQLVKEHGLLQSLDPRVRLLGVLSLVLAATLSRRLLVVLALFILALLVSLASRVRLRSLVGRVWLVAFGFTGFIALPAIFTTPGTVAFRMGPIAATQPGLLTALLLILRVEAAVTLSTALVLCTRWTHLLKALRSLGVPSEVVAMLAMTYRYIFLLIETASQMFESRQSRIVGGLRATEQRRLAVRTAGVLFSKTIDLSNDVYLAMQSRGFRREMELIAEFHMKLIDYAALALFFLTAGIVIFLGR